ncbi:MAG: hypothetical protein V4858_27785 [Pseudomonadota bacterium]
MNMPQKIVPVYVLWLTTSALLLPSQVGAVDTKPPMATPVPTQSTVTANRPGMAITPIDFRVESLTAASTDLAFGGTASFACNVRNYGKDAKPQLVYLTIDGKPFTMRNTGGGTETVSFAFPLDGFAAGGHVAKCLGGEPLNGKEMAFTIKAPMRINKSCPEVKIKMLADPTSVKMGPGEHLGVSPGFSQQVTLNVIGNQPGMAGNSFVCKYAVANPGPGNDFSYEIPCKGAAVLAPGSYSCIP